MPRQNRVTPFGEIIATSERGMVMGNRGVIHDRDGRIRRSWLLKRWILCVLEFKGRRRIVMTPGRYTELFFLDEATGLAAGHRPCAECQRRRYLDYRDAWAIGNHQAGTSERQSALEIDDRLHADRLDPSRSKRTFLANLDDLPDGVFIAREERKDQALLIRGDSLLAWTPGGYRDRLRRKGREVVSVLTPKSSIAAIRAGFVPQVHPSAGEVR
ncbi:MAG TPA: hypothetical protein VKA15_24725 [Isosphaeraceae bacterium]|nr:hypothetical protein [Isosphaeraceae bacterium]